VDSFFEFTFFEERKKWTVGSGRWLVCDFVLPGMKGSALASMLI
jgi:hypothetical protein